VEPSAFNEIEFFRSVQTSGARALLIGRRTLVLLGLPVLTSDYEIWIGTDDISRFNAACEPFDLVPTRSREEARQAGRSTTSSSPSASNHVRRTSRISDCCRP
jgi:hypothetical protein